VKRNAWILGLLAIVVAIMFLVPRFVKPRHRTGLAAVAQGQVAPDFQLKDIDGKTVKLSDYRGKAVILNFWATWCPPCKTEIPWFVDLQDKYRGQGLEVLGVALDDSSEKDIADFAKEMKMNYPVLIGKEETSDLYGGVEALPTTFYIDRSGKILQSVPGLIDRKEIEDNALKALSSKPAGATEARSPMPKREGSQ
jgi:cytochrome c biogenesis protein CcmG/thiol:disulfide interchange protein DsbE